MHIGRSTYNFDSFTERFAKKQIDKSIPNSDASTYDTCPKVEEGEEEEPVYIA